MSYKQRDNYEENLFNKTQTLKKEVTQLTDVNKALIKSCHTYEAKIKKLEQAKDVDMEKNEKWAKLYKEWSVAEGEKALARIALGMAEHELKAMEAETLTTDGRITGRNKETRDAQLYLETYPFVEKIMAANERYYIARVNAEVLRVRVSMAIAHGIDIE